MQHDLLSAQPQTLSRLDWEIYYNRWQPLFWAKIFLIAGFLFYLFSLRQGWDKLRIGGFTGQILGLLTFKMGMAMRAYIAGRTPWSNMYESLLAIGCAMLLVSVIWMSSSENG